MSTGPKFLQILDEGRLTDGRGDRAYFSESLIIFTSNEGAKELGEPTLPADAPAGGSSGDYSSLQDYYFGRLKESKGFRDRPEILNRIGISNIVPFRHIADQSFVLGEVNRLLSVVTASLMKRTPRVILDPLPEDQQAQMCRHIADQARWQLFGMREVKNRFEEVVLAPLAYQLLEQRTHLQPHWDGANLRFAVPDAN